MIYRRALVLGTAGSNENLWLELLCGKFAPGVWSLLDLQEHVRPVILFLSEMHLNNEGAEALHRKLGYDSMCVGESESRARGISLF
jgi:hypothetical protein